MKTGAPPPQSGRLLDQVRERTRYMHYSLKTEKAYLYRVRIFVRWIATQPGDMRYSRDMGVHDVEALLSMMANERKVSASTHNQALAQFCFYIEVLNSHLPSLNNIGRPHQTKRIPSVLTREEVASLLVQIEGNTALPSGSFALRHGHALDEKGAPARQGCGFRLPRHYCALGQRQ